MNRNSVFSDTAFAFCLLLPSFLLFADIPTWSFASALIFWFYRLILDRSGWKTPTRWVTGFFAVLFLGINYFSFRTLVGKEASSSFLVVLLGLKVLEYQDSKENGFLIFLGLYLITSKFLLSTDLLWFSLGVPAMVVLLFYLLPQTFRGKNPRLASLFLLRSILLAVPLGVFLFIYFPRVSTDMFNIDANQKKVGSIGFAQEIEPGSVAALASTDELAFRAEFIHQKPTVNNMYWRGLTLTRSKGMKWERDTELDPQTPVYAVIPQESPFVRITLEPNYQQWLFTLDHTVAIAAEGQTIHRNLLGVYKVTSLIDKRLAYQLRTEQSLSYSRSPNEKPIKIESSNDPEVRQLLKTLKATSRTPEDFINAISDFFSKNRFKYTLTPNDQGSLTLRDFLFSTKKGFCEHFASATALLLNELGVPARVVVGYHGGEFNPVGRFWTIRQRDAHAWIEFVDSKNQ